MDQKANVKNNFFRLLTIKLVLVIVAVLSFFTLLGCPKGGEAGTETQKRVEWKIAQTWGPTLPVFNNPAEQIAESVSKMSGGNFTISIDHASKHKAPLGVLDFVTSGQYEMAHSASYYWKGKAPLTLYFTTMPFGMNAVEQYAWFYEGGGMELMEEVYEPLGVLSFPGGNTGVQMGGWFRKKIEKVDDLKGLKMRIPGFAGEVLSELGANIVNIPPGELYVALERGTLDALEWVGPSLDFALGFHKIAQYYYTGWHEPATELQFLVNRDAFEELPDTYKEMLRVAMRMAAYDMYITSYHESAVNWEKMKKEFPNIQVLTFPEPVMNAIRGANDKLLKDFSEQDAMAAKIIKSQQDYAKQVRVWTDISEYSYISSVKE